VEDGMGEAADDYLSFDPATLSARDVAALLTSVVVPRPIGWISTVSERGVFNLAPHSYFNVFADDPPIVAFSTTGFKDTTRNVRSGGDFVVNIVSEDLAEAMNVSGIEFPPEESEFAWSGLTPVASQRVRAPRVAEAPIALECTVLDVLELGRRPSYMVLGEVVHFHLSPAVLRDGRVAADLLRPLGRLGGSGYSRTADGLFQMRRLRSADAAGHSPPLRGQRERG
jgi:flavin reductase (DIM6/NTAB) family NADH-FMN oxidoreductase RutF